MKRILYMVTVVYGVWGLACPSFAQGAFGRVISQAGKVSTRQLEKEVARQAWLGQLKQVSSSLEKSCSAANTFLAGPLGGPGQYSGTVFQIQHNGKTEVYGVIASHTLATSRGDLGLQKIFTAQVYKGGERISIPARMVQVGATETLDVALVKFREQDEMLFEPLELNEDGLAAGEKIFTKGFARGSSVCIARRTLAKNSFFSLRSPLVGERTDRLGLCGSAIIDPQGKLLGVHTGSRDMFEEDDIGYATHARFLRVLVEAYHNRGNAPYELNIAGKTWIRLQPDEYISRVNFLDEHKQIISGVYIGWRLPVGEIEEGIKRLDPRYVEFVVYREHWKGLSLTGYLQADSDTWLGLRGKIYTYDLQEDKLIAYPRYKVVQQYKLIQQAFGLDKVSSD